MQRAWGYLQPGDVIDLDVNATVRITKVEPSPIRSGMRRFTYEVIDASTEGVCDVGVLVSAELHEELSQPEEVP